MYLSFAPLEGVTTRIFRNIHHEMFPGADRYCAPFIAPDGSGKYKASRNSDILPENNRDIGLIPQILANKAEAFLAVANELKFMGYKEVNLNTGCPSATVVTKHKGSGMLSDLSTLDEFLDGIFSACDMDISVKTRMGLDSVDEFPAILDVFNKYPLKRLTVHARDRAGMYISKPAIAEFTSALPKIKTETEYNGNIFMPGDISKLQGIMPDVNYYMIGRGAVARPSIFREIHGGAPLSLEEYREFHDRLLNAFLADGLSEYFTARRMKELWHYFSKMFPDSEKEIKAINKSKYLGDYKSAVSSIFSSGKFDPNATY